MTIKNWSKITEINNNLPSISTLIDLIPVPPPHPHRAMPVDPMDDVELRSVQLQFPHSRGSLEGTCDIRRVPTDKGELTVAVQGDTRKPAILTYHDLGLNCKS